MNNTKPKIGFLSIIAAVSFVFLAVSHYIAYPITMLLLGYPVTDLIKSFVQGILNLQFISFFVPAIIMAVGTLTKYYKAATAIGSAIFGLSAVLTLVSYIITVPLPTIIDGSNSEYLINELLTFTKLFTAAITYFGIFAISATFVLFDILKKPTPRFWKYLVFIPLGLILVLAACSALQPPAAEMPTYLLLNAVNPITAYNVFIRIFYVVIRLVEFVGYGALLLKITGLSVKK